jgi:hypothetical protein
VGGKVAAVDIPPGLRITVTDARRIGYCARGMKTWARPHGLDFASFLKNGIPAEDLLATGDAFAERIVAAKLNGGRR